MIQAIARVSPRWLCVIGSCLPLGSQTWTRHEDLTPLPRLWPGAAYDALADTTVLFGGGDLGDNDTWELDSSLHWHRFTVGGPPWRMNPAMSFDPAAGVTLLFGGE